MSAALQSPAGRIPLETTPLMLGYTPDSRLLVNDSQATSIAAIITANGQGHTITAVNSAYPISINGQQIGLHQAHWLHPNDSILIGETKLTYEESQPEPYTPIAPTPAGTNPSTYDTDEEKTLKGTADTAWESQPGSAQQVATGPKSPVEQGPFTPPPLHVGSGIQWPQYQAAGSAPYLPPSKPQPFTSPQGISPGSMTAPGEKGKKPIMPSWQFLQSRSGLLKLLLIALVVVLVLVAGGSSILIYQLTRPQPIITLSSRYMQGNVPVGAIGTRVHVTGYAFTGNSPITFLLDNRPVADNTLNVHSDGSGNFQADLPVTSAWSIGTHKLTAKDSGDYSAANIGNISIVNQGEAGTPGPNDAPPDNGSFALKVTVKPNNSPGNPLTLILTVKGNSSGDSTTVCNEYRDAGQQESNSGSLRNGTTYQGSGKYSCQGTYKAGKLSYTEMYSEKLNLSDGSSCQTTSPVLVVQIDGSFSSATTLSGTISGPAYLETCTGGRTASVTFDAFTGTLTASIV